DVPGPVLRKGKVEIKWNHEFFLEVSRSYPYVAPILIWKTEIFHPKIVSPMETSSFAGTVDLYVLDNWKFGYSLKTIAEAIEQILTNPKKSSPMSHESTMEAAEYFEKTEFEAPKRIYLNLILDDEEVEESLDLNKEETLEDLRKKIIRYAERERIKKLLLNGEEPSEDVKLKNRDLLEVFLESS
ncbi:MAG: ubiquitin-conjugating enzyme E2, partial [Candidatus Methanofastidiosia archaeon]